MSEGNRNSDNDRSYDNTLVEVEAKNFRIFLIEVELELLDVVSAAYELDVTDFDILIVVNYNLVGESIETYWPETCRVVQSDSVEVLDLDASNDVGLCELVFLVLNNDSVTTVEYRDRINCPEPYSSGVNSNLRLNGRNQTNSYLELQAVIGTPLELALVSKVSNGRVSLESLKCNRCIRSVNLNGFDNFTLCTLGDGLEVDQE